VTGSPDRPIGDDRVVAALAPLVGEWTLEAKGADGERWPGGGRSTFAWHASGAHLVQRTVLDVPEAPDSTSIIGCDPANGIMIQLYSDERGVCRIYRMSIDGGQWILEREGDPFPQRFVGMISADGQTIDGRWEKAEDGSGFTVDFFLTYRRVPRR
jgi:hypothetical protein